ncbi:hypothetical protein, partial [Pseudomonas sp. FEN]
APDSPFRLRRPTRPAAAIERPGRLARRRQSQLHERLRWRGQPERQPDRRQAALHLQRRCPGKEIHHPGNQPTDGCQDPGPQGSSGPRLERNRHLQGAEV